MPAEDFFQSTPFQKILLGILCFCILFLVFSIGIFVGAKRAEFSFRWADQYHQNFGGPSEGFFGDFLNSGKQFIDSNGCYGRVIGINGNILTVKDIGEDNTEKNIFVDEKTIIVCQKKTWKISNLKLDSNVVIVGAPDSSGRLIAKLIRVMPATKTGCNIN